MISSRLIVPHDVMIDLNLLQFICVLIMSGGDDIIVVRGRYDTALATLAYSELVCKSKNETLIG